MALHWTALIAIVAWLAGVLPTWALALHAFAWAGISIAWGLRGGPSPALPDPWRKLAWLGQAALLALYVVGAVTALMGLVAAGSILMATIAVGVLHGMFNIWRASVLGDGAFRRMLPKALW
ncbi:hypothetical protein jaqu_24300 [Jannaschia aquimarina]|uniref:Uncharacterized protein n=2 Tax=Jannaschia aquimarina TaxID=935700 RepID=A0A0D1EJ83_9RHOB|nr:hypothetical protein jaqu_24300 [Jannaschia aquimarina]SNT09998.1 hypothetical protein SAMN05421775_105246 [Jannaschia aquimarina]